MAPKRISRLGTALSILVSGVVLAGDQDDVQIWLSGRTLAEAAQQLHVQPGAAAPNPPRTIRLADLSPRGPRFAAPAQESSDPPAAAAEEPLLASEGERTVVATGRSERERALLAVLIVGARKLERTDGIPAAATVAMALHESGYGLSQLAAKHNNYFGLKLGKTIGEFVRLPTRELGQMVRADFRVYNSLSEGIAGFATFLRYPRYRDAFRTSAPREFVRRLLLAKYCPERDYEACIEAIMSRHRLDLL